MLFGDLDYEKPLSPVGCHQSTGKSLFCAPWTLELPSGGKQVFLVITAECELSCTLLLPTESHLEVSHHRVTPNPSPHWLAKHLECLA
jgi:hypothetical protein